MTWPLDWWWGALAMGAFTVGFWRAMGRPLGVSVCWTRLVTAREESKLREVEARVAAAPDAFEAAMLAATVEAFGASSEPAAVTPAAAPPRATAVRERWTAHLLFLVAMGMGGLLASFVFRGGISFRFSPGAAFERFFGEGPLSWLVLLGGGLLVGFGTRMCGGCSSGHGLSGVSRLQTGSLITTATFFASAAAASLLLARILG